MAGCIRRYRGRFAPSPTGPLHFGSLVAALGSYLDARSRGGEWLVRMEDVDIPRSVPGAADAILRALERFGLHWDGEVLVQSRRGAAYADALATLKDRVLAYDCACSRRDLADGIYPGTCRDGIPAGRIPRSVRLRTDNIETAFEDRLQGRFGQRLESEVGDFVVFRADGVYAYHLAVTVDDAVQGITDVVRGADLLDSTPRQIHLQRCLDLPTPAYAHLPVAVNRRGQKLSKQTRARPVSGSPTAPLLFEALAFLGQQPDSALRDADAGEILGWGRKHWRLEKVPRRRQIRYRDEGLEPPA